MLTPKEYIGSLMELGQERRGEFKELNYIAENRASIIYELPLAECERPRDVEAYIHRSGRTGRAGNTGVAVLLYEPRYSHSIFRIEREYGVKFEHISAPQAIDVAASEAADAICKLWISLLKHSQRLYGA